MGFSVMPSGQSFPSLWRPPGLLMLLWQRPQGLNRVRGRCWETNSPRAACVSPTTTLTICCPRHLHLHCMGRLIIGETQIQVSGCSSFIHSTYIHCAPPVCWALEGGTEDPTCPHI